MNEAAVEVQILEMDNESLRAEIAKLRRVTRTNAAIAAMQGLCANPALSDQPTSTIIKWSIQHADMLMDELQKEVAK